MSRKIVGIFVCFFALITAGCAFDDHGRGHFTGRGGSLKDTHLNTSSTGRTVQKKHAHRLAGSNVRKHYIAKREDKAPDKSIAASRPVAKVQPEAGSQSKNIAVPEKAEVKGGSSSEGEGIVIVQAPSRPLSVDEKPAEGRNIAEPGKKDESSLPKQQDMAKQEYTALKKEPEPGQKIADASAKKESVEEKKPALALHIGVPQADGVQGKSRTFNSDISGEGAQPYSVVKVYYATDRNLSGRQAPKDFYGSKRSSISYGSCEVSIPKGHKLGELEAPSVWRLEFRENTDKHVVLKKVDPGSKAKFFQDIQSSVKLSHGKNAFIFVHGYNMDFREAALRTAQMAHDLQFDGVPIFYSWPSQGTYKDYTRDEANVQWTQSNLKRFMKDFLNKSDAKNIYLIAHSMGARALTGAVAELVTEMPSVRERIKEVMLAAPDIDAEIFKRDIAPKLVRASRNITLYASSDDKALQMSRTIHGQPRAGDAGNSLVVYRGIDTIDATGIDTSLFGHNYFAEAPTIISDILAIIRFGRRPKDRPSLIPVIASEGQYWAFRQNKPLIVNGTTLIENAIKEVQH